MKASFWVRLYYKLTFVHPSDNYLSRMNPEQQPWNPNGPTSWAHPANPLGEGKAHVAGQPDALVIFDGNGMVTSLVGKHQYFQQRLANVGNGTHYMVLLMALGYTAPQLDAVSSYGYFSGNTYTPSARLLQNPGLNGGGLLMLFAPGANVGEEHFAVTKPAQEQQPLSQFAPSQQSVQQPAFLPFASQQALQQQPFAPVHQGGQPQTYYTPVQAPPPGPHVEQFLPQGAFAAQHVVPNFQVPLPPSMAPVPPKKPEVQETYSAQPQAKTTPALADDFFQAAIRSVLEEKQQEIERYQLAQLQAEQQRQMVADQQAAAIQAAAEAILRSQRQSVAAPPIASEPFTQANPVVLPESVVTEPQVAEQAVPPHVYSQVKIEQPSAPSAPQTLLGIAREQFLVNQGNEPTRSQFVWQHSKDGIHFLASVYVQTKADSLKLASDLIRESLHMVIVLQGNTEADDIMNGVNKVYASKIPTGNPLAQDAYVEVSICIVNQKLRVLDLAGTPYGSFFYRNGNVLGINQGRIAALAPQMTINRQDLRCARFRLDELTAVYLCTTGSIVQGADLQAASKAHNQVTQMLEQVVKMPMEQQGTAMASHLSMLSGTTKMPPLLVGFRPESL